MQSILKRGALDDDNQHEGDSVHAKLLHLQSKTFKIIYK